MSPLKNVRDPGTFLHQRKIYYLKSVQEENYLGRRKSNVIIKDFFWSHNMYLVYIWINLYDFLFLWLLRLS